ncbi:MAG: hypothetical protein NVSMB3_03250 [Acidobacteriaceae bacterium]
MRLKTKLVLSATALTFAVVVGMSTIFVGELLRQRIEQTTSATEVLAQQVVLVTLQALDAGLHAKPPKDRSDEALKGAVFSALRSDRALLNVMNAIVRYSLTVQDVNVTDTAGVTVVSTDPDALGQRSPVRSELSRVKEENFWGQTRELFGKPRVLDLSESIQRNGKPFLLVHLGVRSTFLRASYEPWLRTALALATLAALISMGAAALLANLALSPLEQISRQLEHLGVTGGAEEITAESEGEKTNPDAVVRVTRSIDRLGEQMRSTEAGYTALRSNLNKMLDTLRDGVLLFTENGRAAMASDSAAYLLDKPEHELVGSDVQEIFDARTTLGAAVLRAFESGRQVSGESVKLEDGREVQFSLDRIHDGKGSGKAMGTLVRLRDVESAAQLEQELEVSRRLAAVGRLTAGVGHEVKNPINAMVVHLELLKSKLAGVDGVTMNGAQKHVEILAGEMQRLDRVVETLADFSRPMELHLADRDLRDVVAAVVELTGAEMEENGVRVLVDVPNEPVVARVDAELIRQALLNLMLNGMQSMPGGGPIRVSLRRDHNLAIVQVVDAGEGIAQEVLPRIFDLYFTTKAKGSGIGLAMTYRILQMHGGAMEVFSSTDAASPDRGTTFTLRLPVVPAMGEMRKLTSMAARASRDGGERI